MSSQVRFTAYGAAALGVLRTVVAEAKRDDPMAPVTLVVPNNIAGIVARRHLARYGASDDRPGIAALYIATLPRLAEQFAAVHLHPRRPATAAVVSSAWRAALDADPGVFAAVKDHPATIQALVNAHRELRDLTEPSLDAVAAASGLAAEVVRLYRSVVTTLAGEWYDATDLLRAAVPRAADRPDEVGELVLYLPQRLSLAESGFARALAEQQRMTVIAGTTSVDRADAAVLTVLTRLGIDHTPAKQDPPTSSRVRHASDSDDEVREVVRSVVSALPHTPAHRIALLYSAAVPYARLLHEQLADARIQVNGLGVRPVHERAVARGFLGVLALADRDLPRADFFQAVAEAPVRIPGGGRVPVARWERTSRLAGILGGADWATRTAYLSEEREADIANEQEQPDPSPGRIEGYQRDIESASGLAAFATTLRAELRAAQQLASWTALSDWALALFAELYGARDERLSWPTEEQYAAASIERSLAGLAVLERFESATDLHRLREVLELDLEAALPRVGTFGTGVFVGPLSSAIGLDADLVFVLGLWEDLYPGRVRQDALLPERVRDVTDLVATREGIDAKHRHLLGAFTTAPHVVASFPRGDLRRSSQRLPSRFLLPTLRTLTGDKELAAGDWDSVACSGVSGSASYAAGLSHVDLPPTEQEWRVRAVRAGIDLGDEALDAARAVVLARGSDKFTRYDGNLHGAGVTYPTSPSRTGRCHPPRSRPTRPVRTATSWSGCCGSSPSNSPRRSSRSVPWTSAT